MHLEWLASSGHVLTEEESKKINEMLRERLERQRERRERLGIRERKN